MKHTSLLTLTLLLPAVSYAQNADSIPSLEDHQLGHRLIYTGQNANHIWPTGTMYSCADRNILI